MGFVPEKILIRPTNTTGHSTRSTWKNRQEIGRTSATASTSCTTHTLPRSIHPNEGLPIKRVKRTAGILLILFLVWALIHAFKIF